MVVTPSETVIFFKKETETVWGTEGDDSYEYDRFYKGMKQLTG